MCPRGSVPTAEKSVVLGALVVLGELGFFMVGDGRFGVCWS